PGSVSYGPQTYSFTVNGESFMDQAGNPVTEPQPFVLPGNVTQFQSIMFKEGANFNNEFIDNVSLVNFITIVDGDFNEDGFVDAADYVYWRKNTPTDEELYNLWRSNFGAGLDEASGAVFGVESYVVPEPSTALLVALGGIGCFAAIGRVARTGSHWRGLR
ncbi:MAG: PEP-CTERM sorting domain-containing protein, partial [Pirellulales bacterium]